MKTTRQRWMEAGFRTLDEDGADGISADRLARRLGVTRGAFYHHFTNREDFVRTLLGAWEREYTGQILALARDGDSAEERLVRYLAVAATMNPQREVAIRAWALRDPLVAEYQQRVDSQRLEFARALCRLVATDHLDADFFGQMAHLCFIGTQQTTLPMNPSGFMTFFHNLFDAMRRLARCESQSLSIDQRETLV